MTGDDLFVPNLIGKRQGIGDMGTETNGDGNKRTVESINDALSLLAFLNATLGQLSKTRKCRHFIHMQ